MRRDRIRRASLMPGSGAVIRKVPLYDGVSPVEVEVDFVVALGLARIRLRAEINVDSPGLTRCCLWSSKQESIATVRAQPRERGAPLLAWVSRRIDEAVEDDELHDERPSFGTGTVLIRVGGCKAAEIVFGVMEDKVNSALDVSHCRSVWRLVVEVLRRSDVWV